MGRPRTERTEQRVVRLTAEEDALVAAQAAELGLTPAAFLRLAGLRKLPRRRGALDPEMAREIWRQVSGVARNVNQLARHAHMGNLQPGELEGLRAEVQALVRWAMEASGA